METVTINVQGMTCGHCEKAVRQALLAVDPEASVQIDRTSGDVKVQSTATHDALAAAIQEEGYTVEA